MFFYLFIFLIVLCLFLLSDFFNLNNLNKKIIRCLGVFIFWFISSFRYDVGRDYLSYRASIIFLDSNYLRSEFINKGLFYIAHCLSFPQFYFFVTTSIIFISFHKTISKYSNYYTISFLIFLSIPVFFFNSLSIVRQFVAIGLVFYSTYYILTDRSFFKFLLIVILASGFHISAIVAIPLFFINKINIKNWVIISLFVFPTIFKEPIIELIFNFYPHYGKYITYKYGLNAGGEKAVYLFLIISILLLFFKKKLIKLSNNNKFYFNAILLGTIFYFAFVDFGHIGMRVASYFVIYVVLLIPEMINLFRTNSKVIIKLLMYLIFFVLYIISITIGIKNGESSFIPFQFNLFN